MFQSVISIVRLIRYTKHEMAKRGRKPKDEIDTRLERDRKHVKRGVEHVSVPDPASPDEVVMAVLARELDIIKSRELVEIREALITQDPIEDESICGNPVCTRLYIPPTSVKRVLINSVNQMVYAEGQGSRNIAFTPESHVLMSKACELFVTELATRAFLDVTRGQKNTTLTSDNVHRGAVNAWRSKRQDDHFSCAPLDFLMDSLRPAGLYPDPLDKLARIHKIN